MLLRLPQLHVSVIGIAGRPPSASTATIAMTHRCWRLCFCWTCLKALRIIMRPAADLLVAVAVDRSSVPRRRRCCLRRTVSSARSGAGTDEAALRPHLENRAVLSEPHADPVADRRALDPLAFDEQAVAALQIADRPLTARERHLGVPPAGVRVLDLDLALEVAADVEGAVEAEDAAVRQPDGRGPAGRTAVSR